MKNRKRRNTYANVDWERHAEPLILTVNLALLPDIAPPDVAVEAFENPEDALNTSATLTRENARRAIAVDAIIHNAAQIAFPPSDATYRQGFSETHMIIALRGAIGIRQDVEVAVLPKGAPFANHLCTAEEVSRYVAAKPEERLLLSFAAMSTDYAEGHDSQPWLNLPAHSPKTLDAFLGVVLNDFIRLQLGYNPEEREGTKITVMGDVNWLPKRLKHAFGPCSCCDGHLLVEVIA